MKILIDCTQITKNKAGVGVYAYNTVRELVGIDSRDKFYLLVQNDDPDMAFYGHENVRLISLNAKLFRIIPLRFLVEQLYIPYLVHRYEIDVIHSLHYSFPLLGSSAKNVVTIHDMTAFLLPEMHLPLKAWYYKFFIRKSARRNHDLIFVSHSALADYLKLFPNAISSNHVIQLGKSSLFRPDLDPAVVQSTISKYEIGNPYLLFVGTIEPRKNLMRLVHAFAELSKRYPAYDLVIAGMKGWMYDSLFELVNSLQLEEKVKFIGFIEENDKPYLIRGAEVFVYPSLYEGFGIPVLESLSCGTPTVTSNISAMPEIAGDAALLVNPNSKDEIIHALESLIGSPSLREELSTRSVRRAAQFVWSKTANETLKVYCKAFVGQL